MIKAEEEHLIKVEEIDDEDLNKREEEDDAMQHGELDWSANPWLPHLRGR